MTVKFIEDQLADALHRARVAEARAAHYRSVLTIAYGAIGLWSNYQMSDHCGIKLHDLEYTLLTANAALQSMRLD